MPGNRLLFWSCALAVLAAFILVGRTGPLATLFLGTWVPLPLLLVGLRQGTGSAALLALAGGGVGLALSFGHAAFPNDLGLWTLLLLGLILTVCHHRGWTPGSGIMVATVVVGGIFSAWFSAQAYVQGLGLREFCTQKSQEITTVLLSTLEQAGMEMSDWRLAGFPSFDLRDFLARTFPALALVNTALVGWVNVLVARRAASRYGWGEPGEPLSRWSCPEWLVFVLAAAGFALLAPLPWVRTVGLNLLLVMAFAYFCQGMAVIAGLVQRYQTPWGLRPLIYILAFVNPIMIMVMLLGLMDLWLDFRRLQPPREA